MPKHITVVDMLLSYQNGTKITQIVKNTERIVEIA